MKKAVLILMVAMMAVLLVPMFIHPPASAAGPSVQIDIGVTDKPQGGDFTVTVNVYGLTKFHAANYSITWNPSAVFCKGVFVAGAVNSTSLKIDKADYDNVNGVLNVNSSLITTSGIDGSGWLSNISFQVQGSPCDTNEFKFNVSQCHLWDDEAPPNEIVNATWIGDSIHVVPSGPTPSATPSPSPSATPTVSPTATVTASPTPTRTGTPTPSASATSVSATTTPTLSITPTVTPSPTPTLMISMNAPAKVNHSGNFTARIDFANLNITAGNYSASYIFNYDKNVIVATNVTDGLIGSSVIPVSNWSFVTEGVQGVISVVQNISSPEAVQNGSGILANISFDVVGGYDNTSDIKFNVSNCSVCVLPDMTSCLPAGWLKGTVRVATPTVQNTYNLTVNQTSSCCNVSVAGYGNVTSGSSRTWSDISSGTVINVNASFNGSCNTWGNWSSGVGNISAMNTTVTMSGTKTIIANCTYTSGPGPVGGSNTPSWLWPVVGVMLFLTLVLFGYAANRAGWIGKPKGWFGGHMEDYTADGFGEEDVYDKLYGDTGGIEKGTGGGSDMGNDKL